MLKEVEAVILAGGIGSRMGELTRNRQKCMLEVEEKPILEYIFDNIVDSFGSARVVMATGFMGESIRDYFGTKYRNISLDYVHSPEQLEVRKRLLLAKDLLKGSFLYLPGDAITNSLLLEQVVVNYEKEGNVFGSVSGAIKHTTALSYALITTDKNHAVEFIFPPSTNWNENQLREIGIMYLNHDFLTRLTSAPQNELNIVPVINDALKNEEQFTVEKYFDRWYHFAVPKDLNVSIVFDNKLKVI